MASLPTPGVTTDWGDDLNAVIRSALGGDAAPESPNAQDDEFDGTSTATWTSTTPAPNAFDVNTTTPSRLYLKASGSSGTRVGRYQAIPAAYPFTITTKLSGTTSRFNNHRGGGLMLWSSDFTQYTYWGNIFNTIHTLTQQTPPAGTYNELQLTRLWWPTYLRLTVQSSSVVDFLHSSDGMLWSKYMTVNPIGFTPAYMGLAISEEGGGGCEAAFDFFRVT